MNRIKYYKKVKIVNEDIYANYFGSKPIKCHYITINKYLKCMNEFVKVYDLINFGAIQYEKFIDFNNFEDKDSYRILEFNNFKNQRIQYKHLIKPVHNPYK